MLILSLLFCGLHATDCSEFGCSCQGLSDRYGVEAGVSFGCTPPWAVEWWKNAGCFTSPSNEGPYPGCSRDKECRGNVLTGLVMTTDWNHPGTMVSDNGCCGNDFNANAGGSYIYLIQETFTHFPRDRGIVDLWARMDSSSCPSGYELVSGCCGSDFNSGAGGDKVYMCAKYSRFGPFVDEVKMYGNQDSHWDPPCNGDGWRWIHNSQCEDDCDFNEGTHGMDHMHIYVCYHMTPECYLSTTLDETKQICKKVVDLTNASDGYPLQEITIEGKAYPVTWDVFEWTPTAEVRNYEHVQLTDPMTCTDQALCSVSATTTTIHTADWQLTGDISVHGGVEFGVSAGIPEIFTIGGGYEIGAEVGIGFSKGGSESLEQSMIKTYACTQRDYATTCTVFTERGEFLVYGRATPIINFNQQQVQCKDFEELTDIEWWGESDHGSNAVEQIICTDSENYDCDYATAVYCETDAVTKWNCPHTCNTWGFGPSPCKGGADCGFEPVLAEQCPSPHAIEPVGGVFPDCNQVVFTPGVLCEATRPFTIEDGPDWQIKNCPGKPDIQGDIFMHSIWLWHCTHVEGTANMRADWNSASAGDLNSASAGDLNSASTASLGSTHTVEKGDKGQGSKETWTEQHYEEHTWTPMSIMSRGVNMINVIPSAFALIGACAVVVALKNRCMKTNTYTTIEDNI